MKIVYDKQSDALYIYLTDKGHAEKAVVKKTLGDWPAHIDYNGDNNPFGIEILDASKTLNLDYLRSIEYVEVDQK